MQICYAVQSSVGKSKRRVPRLLLSFAQLNPQWLRWLLKPPLLSFFFFLSSLLLHLPAARRHSPPWRKRTVAWRHLPAGGSPHSSDATAPTGEAEAQARQKNPSRPSCMSPCQCCSCTRLAPEAGKQEARGLSYKPKTSTLNPINPKP